MTLKCLKPLLSILNNKKLGFNPGFYFMLIADFLSDALFGQNVIIEGNDITEQFATSEFIDNVLRTVDLMQVCLTSKRLK